MGKYEHLKELGVYIRSQREHLDITLTAFAQILGISKSYLSDIERGNRTCTKKRLAHIAWELAFRLYDRHKTFYEHQHPDRESLWLTMYQHLLVLSKMMSYSYNGLRRIQLLLNTPKLKKKNKLEAIQEEVNTVFFEDFESWIEVNDV